MMRFISFLRASLVVVVVASIVCNTDAAIQYVNGATIFGSCADFSIQAGTSVSFNGVQTNVISGHVGIAPGTSITGSQQLGLGYSKQANTASAINCAADALTAYKYIKGITCTNKLVNPDLSGVTLYAGVYCTGSGFLTLKTTALYLDAQGDDTAQFIFQTASTVIISANTRIILVNGALIENIYWQVGSSVTLGTSSSFVGQILAYKTIAVAKSVTVNGRLFSQAAVTFAGTDVITLPPQN